MDTGIIYKITCSVNGIAYIGKTTQGLKTRFTQHFNKRSKCRLLKAAVEEHGRSSFKIETLWEGPVGKLGIMEKKMIIDHNTLCPNGYNLKKGGGRGEKACQNTKENMIVKQREISMRKKGKLGYILENKSKGNNRIVSWSLKVYRNGNPYTVSNSKNKEEVLKIQEEFTKDPDGFIIPERTPQVSKHKGIFHRKDRNKWLSHSNNIYLGMFLTEEDAINAKKSYEENPDNFILPKGSNREDIGITFHNAKNKWVASFYKDKVNTFLGNYDTQEEAINARKRFIDSPDTFVRPNVRVKDKDAAGVSFHVRDKKWSATFTRDKKLKYVGSYETKEEAISARKRYIDSLDTIV